jgi:hypothetical protein
MRRYRTLVQLVESTAGLSGLGLSLHGPASETQCRSVTDVGLKLSRAIAGEDVPVALLS